MEAIFLTHSKLLIAYKLVYHLSEYLVHKRLKDIGDISESNWHHNILIVPFSSEESCIPLIIFLDASDFKCTM